MNKAAVSKPVIEVLGFDDAGHRMPNLRFRSIRMPVGVLGRVKQAARVEFENVVSGSGEKSYFGSYAIVTSHSLIP
jgi:hypothetical protein